MRRTIQYCLIVGLWMWPGVVGAHLWEEPCNTCKPMKENPDIVECTLKYCPGHGGQQDAFEKACYAKMREVMSAMNDIINASKASGESMKTLDREGTAYHEHFRIWNRIMQECVRPGQ
jgi:hypothetical protein